MLGERDDSAPREFSPVLVDVGDLVDVNGCLFICVVLDALPDCNPEVAASLRHELSRLRLLADGKREESFGRWQFNRNGELPNYLANEGKDNPQDTRAQARFVARRMEELHPGFSKITDPKLATDLVAVKFERYKGAAPGQRYGYLSEAERRLGGAAEPTGAPDFLVAVGDSIAAHLIRKANVGGKEYNADRKADSTAVSGLGPAAILDVIASMPEENIKGRHVLLSSGVSNDPSQLPRVREQIDTLKSRGAAKITLLGVGTADKLRGVNEQLAQIAQQNGVTFAGPLRKVAGDGIHSSDPADLLAQAQAAVSSESPQAKVPDLDQWLRNIEAHPTATQRQKDIAAAIVTRDYHRQKAAVAAATRQEVAAVKSLMKDDNDSITTTGQPVSDLTPDRVAAALGPDAADEFAANRSTAFRYFRADHGFREPAASGD